MTAPFPPPLTGRPATVMGLGLFGGGVAAARWLTEQGARVTVTDLRDASVLAPALEELNDLDLELVLGEHREVDFVDTDMVVVNPAVPPGSPLLELARGAGAVVTSEAELFLRTTPARLALVTGTHGKSSTTTILAQLLEASGIPARPGGNIGEPLLGAIPRKGEVFVVELSSYQLEALAQGCPPLEQASVAAVTALAPDHLERHGTMSAYATAKARLGELCPGLWLPADLDLPEFDPYRKEARRFGPGAPLRIEEGEFRLGEEFLGHAADVPLPGDFQLWNTLLALGMARDLGADPTQLAAALCGLKGLPHRLEDLGQVAGRRVLDNGVSTTPDSTLAALTSVQGPCTLLVGGKAKDGLELGPLLEGAALARVQVIAFGSAGPMLASAFRASGVQVEVASTVEEATSRGLELTPAGGTLLFSPACASFDAYPNFRARALAFQAALQT